MSVLENGITFENPKHKVFRIDKNFDIFRIPEFQQNNCANKIEKISPLLLIFSCKEKVIKLLHLYSFC